MKKEIHQKTLAAAILSLSLLTVMAGAAVAPALGVIRDYFHQESGLLIQMIISMPALFIFLSSLIFPALSERFGSKTLVTAGLILYTAGGVAAGCFSNIWLVLLMRALVGIGVGIIMPLSTGLIAWYFPAEKMDQMMGYSSAMNQLGGVVATLLSGVLAAMNWRASFLVYLMGFLSIVLCAVFLPNERIRSGSSGIPARALKEYLPYYGAMFFLMMSFFLYPSNCAIETTKDGVIPQGLIAAIMAGADMVAIVSGILYVKIKGKFGAFTRLMAPVLFFLGFLLMYYPGGWTGTLAGSALIGFANGMGIPYIIAQASLKAGKHAAAAALPLVSAAMYFSQFLTPFAVSAIRMIPVIGSIHHMPYLVGMLTSLIFLIWSLFLLKPDADGVSVS